jgi:hypothetical protein
MECRLSTVGACQSHRHPPNNSLALGDMGLRKIRVRRDQTATMIHRHGPVVHDDASEAHHSVSDGRDIRPFVRSNVNTPMPSPPTDRCERAYDNSVLRNSDSEASERDRGDDEKNRGKQLMH